MRGRLWPSRRRSGHGMRGQMQPSRRRRGKRREEGRVEAREGEELCLAIPALDLHGVIQQRGAGAGGR
jgi:hypothetical protein